MPESIDVNAPAAVDSPSATVAPTAHSLRVERVRWDDPRAMALRGAMDTEMIARYSLRGPTTSEQDAAVDRALAVDPGTILATVLVSGPGGMPVGHAALRDLRGEWEVKRVMVDAGHRGRGIGRLLMAELESIAREAGARRLILQTGDRQPDAVVLYEHIGYTPIAIYEPYVEAIPFSLCFEKRLTA